MFLKLIKHSQPAASAIPHPPALPPQMPKNKGCAAATCRLSSRLWSERRICRAVGSAHACIFSTRTSYASAGLLYMRSCNMHCSAHAVSGPWSTSQPRSDTRARPKTGKPMDLTPDFQNTQGSHASPTHSCFSISCSSTPKSAAACKRNRSRRKGKGGNLAVIRVRPPACASLRIRSAPSRYAAIHIALSMNEIRRAPLSLKTNT